MDLLDIRIPRYGEAVSWVMDWSERKKKHINKQAC